VFCQIGAVWCVVVLCWLVRLGLRPRRPRPKRHSATAMYCGALLGWVAWALRPRQPRPQHHSATSASSQQQETPLRRRTKEASEKPGLCRRGRRSHKHQQPATTGTITQENHGGKREAIHVISPLCRVKTIIWKLCVLNWVLFDPVLFLFGALLGVGWTGWRRLGQLSTSSV
jgi:hypothetical protein